MAKPLVARGDLENLGFLIYFAKLLEPIFVIW